MPRPALTAEQVEWLKENWTKHKWVELEKLLGACTDTLKRVLVRSGVASFPAAKYQTSRTASKKMWSRPCMRCKDEEPREVGLYLCEKCRGISASPWDD